MCTGSCLWGRTGSFVYMKYGRRGRTPQAQSKGDGLRRSPTGVEQRLVPPQTSMMLFAHLQWPHLCWSPRVMYLLFPLPGPQRTTAGPRCLSWTDGARELHA